MEERGRKEERGKSWSKINAIFQAELNVEKHYWENYFQPLINFLDSQLIVFFFPLCHWHLLPIYFFLITNYSLPTTTLKTLQINPKLTLVGAGPGDVELITLKAIKALKVAKVILYDALVNPELLEYASEECLKIFVGKRVGQHSFQQDEIHELIVKYAFSHGHVVRLKGGDPFVFGRGHEEIEYAEIFGLQTEVVPGISSALSVPAMQKIPLTKRGINQSFWVITGTTKEGRLAKDVVLAAQSSATVVILMGTRKLRQITEVFQRFGKANTGVAIIQNGTRPDEKVVLGTIDTIVESARSNQIASPAIIVIGNVAKEHPDFYQQLAQVKQLELAG